MQKWIATKIRDAGIDLELEADYSGRGMYGEQTYSLTGTMQELLVAAAYVAIDLADAGPKRDEYIDALRRLRTDSMGRETVFY